VDRSNYRIGPHRTALRDIGPHWSFIVLHRTTYVTKTVSKDYLLYLKYCSSSS